MAAADLQPALEEDQREGWDMEEAPEIRDACFAELRVHLAEHTYESGAV